jgi:hypothetical protein
MARKFVYRFGAQLKPQKSHTFSAQVGARTGAYFDPREDLASIILDERETARHNARAYVGRDRWTAGE